MRSFCQVLGLINLGAFYASVFWLIGDRSGSGSPAIAGVLSLNMAMGWLFLAGVTRNDAGERVWTGRPAVMIVFISVVLVGLALLGSR